MGYDMYWEQQPEEMVADYAVKQQEFDDAVKKRDAAYPRGGPHGHADIEASPEQKAVHEAYRAMLEAEGYYFRLNIWGMGIARTVMALRGMVHEYGYPDQAAWEALPEYDESHPDDDGGPEYRAARDALVGATVEHPGIAIWKFGSNDGWLVTPIEIKSALALYKASCEASGDDPVTWMPYVRETGRWAEEVCAPDVEGAQAVEWWQSWLLWLGGAAEHGGFRVH